MNRIALLVLALATSVKVPLRSAPATSPLASAQPCFRHFEAVVDQAIPAGSYTYFEVHQLSGARTTVVTMGEVPSPLPSVVEVNAYACTRDFESKRLNRHFCRAVVRHRHTQTRSLTSSHFLSGRQE